MNSINECRYGKMMYSTNDAYVGRSFALYGEYSFDETRLIESLVEPGHVAVEVGANVGALTIPMGKAAGKAGFVLAFEPQRTAYYALCGNVFINGLHNVFCHQRALGAVQGVASIPEIDYEIPGNYGALSINGPSPFDKIPNKLPVDVNPLDDFNLGECHFIKVDVEGMELEVLLGAAKTIDRHRPVLCVENDRNDKRDELFHYLRGLKYECWQHFPAMYNPANFLGNHENVFGRTVSCNLICFPSEGPRKRSDYDDFEFLEPYVKITVNH